MNSARSTLWIVARNELTDSARSRRVLVLLLLYLVGGMAGTALFISFLQNIEGQLVRSLGLGDPTAAGSVTATLWKSAMFRELLTKLIGDQRLAESLLNVPPLALYYGWLSFAFTPALVMLTAAPRVAEEIATGSARYVMFRAGRAAWCLGKLAGQALQILGALLLSALGAWLVGAVRMKSFEPGATALFMFWFAFKAWLYALPYLGLALGISQMCSSLNTAQAFGFLALVGLAVLNRVAHWQAGDGGRRIWDVLGALTPGSHRAAMWWNDLEHLGPALVFLLALGALYWAVGYWRFSRRDL